MTQERKNELYDKMLAWICEHIQNDEDLFLTLKGQLGMTQEEVYDSRIDGLDEFFVKDKIKQLADYAINECCDNSENCYWSITYDELYYHFGADVTDSNENGKLLEKELRQRKEINELLMTYDRIEMTCHLRYCPQCQGDPVSLFSVLGCNLYDDHETEHNREPANESSDEDETQALSM